MIWNLELPTREACTSYKNRGTQGQERINELLGFSHNLFAASAVNFAWLDWPNHSLWVGGHIAMQQYFDEYKAKLLPVDPLGLDTMIANRRKVFCLSQLHCPSAKRGEELLKPYGFSDELDLVLHHHGEPIAILTIFSREQFKEDLPRLKSMQRFLELYIENHPYVRTQACHQLLRDKYRLTMREIEVVEHILDGASNADIAEILKVAVATVKTHVVRALSKTDTNTRSELIALLKE